MRMRGVVVALALATAGCAAAAPADLRPGDCFDIADAEAADVSQVALVGCEGSHDAEAYLAEPFTDVDAFDPEAIASAADAACSAGFSSYVGISYLNSELHYRWFAPTEASWSAGERELVCFIVGAGPVTGTARGSHR